MKQSQAQRLRTLLDDGRWHRIDEIQRVVYGSECKSARIAARVNDLRKAGLWIDGEPSPENKKWWRYRWRKPHLDDLFAHAATAVSLVVLIIPAWLL